MKILNILFLSAIITFSSCNKDDGDKDETASCQETEITMKVNGELLTFYAYGRGLDLRADDYELSLNFGRDQQNPVEEQRLNLYLPYKATGENIIEQFQYSQYINKTFFSGDFVNGELQSKVITNTENCFRMTFSGKLSDGTQEVVITEGKISYTYDEPFDE